MSPAPRIRVIDGPISKEEVRACLGQPFPELIKFVVDLRRRRLALGGELHADAEAVLLDLGSDQEELWGGNDFPGAGETACLEFGSMINVRPSSGNRSLFVESLERQARIRELVFAFVGRGEDVS